MEDTKVKKLLWWIGYGAELLFSGFVIWPVNAFIIASRLPWAAERLGSKLAFIASAGSGTAMVGILLPLAIGWLDASLRALTHGIVIWGIVVYIALAYWYLNILDKMEDNVRHPLTYEADLRRKRRIFSPFRRKNMLDFL